MKLLKTIRADRSDTFVFDKTAQPGEWAVSGAFMFARQEPAPDAGKARACGFGADFWVSTRWAGRPYVQVVEANEEDSNRGDRVTGSTITCTLRSTGSPGLQRAAAAEEIDFCTITLRPSLPEC